MTVDWARMASIEDRLANADTDDWKVTHTPEGGLTLHFRGNATVAFLTNAAADIRFLIDTIVARAGERAD